MSSDEQSILGLGLIVGFFAGFLTAFVFAYRPLEIDVTSQKNFILDQATYKCAKTNELTEEE